LALNESVEELIGLARYAHVPICNLKNDKLNYITDVIYARIMKNANCVSWYSLDGNPEIGGGKSIF
jgi:DNA polymerase epsilon subunit 1